MVSPFVKIWIATNCFDFLKKTLHIVLYDEKPGFPDYRGSFFIEQPPKEIRPFKNLGAYSGPPCGHAKALGTAGPGYPLVSFFRLLQQFRIQKMVKYPPVCVNTSQNVFLCEAVPKLQFWNSNLRFTRKSGL
jgi:hypothetical protein